MRKCDEISDPKSCLNKAADDEVVFVLRAQDALAPGIVRRWAAELERVWRVVSPDGLTLEQYLKLEEAEKAARAMEAWGARERSKVPD